jgi:anaerobic magnesium-protoporphyrin IX monomethyl ester cyclase
MGNKGKVLLIIHDNHQEDNIFPLGPGYLAAVLKKAGAEVQTYCMDLYHYTNKQLAEYLLDNKFDLIGLGFMAPRFNRTVKGVCEVVNAYKKDAWLVLGGHGITPIPEYILKTTTADVAVIGEGEDTFVELLFCKLNNPNRIVDLKGVAFRVEKKITVNNRRKPIMKLDSIPFPDWESFPMEEYTTSLKYAGMQNNDKSFPVITTRGCVSKCSFCHRMEAGIRVRSTANIINEVRILIQSYGVKYFQFADELSIVSKKQILGFTDLLIKYKLDIIYRMDCRVDIFDEEIARGLKNSGCVFLNIGFESTDQNVLDLMNKKVGVDQNIRAAEIAKEMGIGIGLNFICGLPGDSEKSLKRNVEFIKKYNQYDQIRTVRAVTPYPGSPLYYEAIRMGLLKGPEDFFDRFKNADLYMVNFMDIPENEIYQMLFEVNKDLILDHYEHTTKDMFKANQLIDKFYNLYFNSEYTFSGPRHAVSNTDVRRNMDVGQENI